MTKRVITPPAEDRAALPTGPAPLVTPDGSAQLTSRRPGRELFPASWLRREARIEYGDAQSIAGTLLEICRVGLILQTNGRKTLVSWDALQTVELMEG